jgi:hypothetical protein
MIRPLASRYSLSSFIFSWFCIIFLLGLPGSVLGAKELPVVRLAAAPPLDGSLEAWKTAPEMRISSPDGTASFRVAYDDTAFYARVEVKDDSPLRNTADRGQEMLKGGDAVGFYFGTPATGGQRVMFGRRSGRDEVWLYRPVSAEKKPHVFSSLVGDEKFDYVGLMPEARVFAEVVPGGYLLEAAIPWKALGIRPEKTMPFDLQIIFSDPAGSTNVGGVWWCSNNGANLTVEDLPTEAKLYPEGWGVIRFVESAEPPKATPPRHHHLGS